MNLLNITWIMPITDYKISIRSVQTCEVNFYRAQITINSFECYNPLSDTWKLCPALPTSRSEAGAVVI
jgi:hypothetical protein